MIEVKLPDGSVRSLDDGACVLDLAKQIGPGLAKASVVGRVNGNLVDLSVALVTKKDPEALEVLRHSAAHMMADAVLRVFPGAELTIGPVVEDGFYYDIHMPEGGKITPEDFPKIEKEMQQIAKSGSAFQRCVSDGNDEIFAKYRAIDGGKNKFKAELIEGIKERGDEMSFYKHGEFIDLCRGPHVPSTSLLKNVKLTKVSGAYWRADAAREQLVRVYGTAFFTKEELADYLHALQEANKRDRWLQDPRIEPEEHPRFYHRRRKRSRGRHDQRTRPRLGF